MDSERGSYPCWNQKLCLALPYHINFISVEVQCGVARSKVRPVASAKVPVSDIDGDYVPSHFLHFLSYRLRQRDGERNGIINLCIRVLLRPDDQINVCRTLGPLGFSSGKNWSKKLNGGHEVQKGVKVGDISHNVALGIPIATVYATVYGLEARSLRLSPSPSEALATVRVIVLAIFIIIIKACSSLSLAAFVRDWASPLFVIGREKALDLNRGRRRVCL
ncbi:hypothetical protein Scep_006546 [Stephania cephalantha]|uniref:C2 domain-containing protein n=1 Tax=Stephania cephalantha TaxID=152367 RepID=A0AAP0PMB9_9MAGN